MRRTALITGAGQGVGAAIARTLAAEGVDLVLADVQEDAVRRVAHELAGAAGTAHPVGADIRDPASLRRLIAEAEEVSRGVDILVNNAARTVSRPLWEIDADEWDAVLETNVRSVFLTSTLLGRRMRERGWGRIVNLASIAGQDGGTVAGAHYAASKAGILVLTKIVAAELAAQGVTVNAVAPAAIDGPAMRGLVGDRAGELTSRIPVGRLGRPEEVAALVAYLASDDAGYITGATFDVNGGLLMR